MKTKTKMKLFDGSYVALGVTEDERFQILSQIVEEDLLPEPQELPGLAHKERVLLRTNVPDKKNARGETENLTRVAGTGSRDETTVGSFMKGIDIRELPPKLLFVSGKYPLFGGFGRADIFDELGYAYWIYDVYEYASETERTELQDSNLDVLEDASITDNGRSHGKPAKKEDYVTLLVRRIQEKGWNRDTCKQWFKSISHCLTPRQVSSYITSAMNQKNAIGRIEWFKDSDVRAKSIAYNKQMHILNTTDCNTGNNQRFLRTIVAMMQSYVKSGGQTQEYLLWNSQANSHESMDECHLAAEGIMNEFLELCKQFVFTMMLKDTVPCLPTKVLYQKINGTETVGSIVDYPATEEV